MLPTMTVGWTNEWSHAVGLRMWRVKVVLDTKAASVGNADSYIQLGKHW